MPAPVTVTINSKVYNIPILNGEMDNVVQQMEQQKEEIQRLNRRKQNAKVALDTNCNTLLLMYIQQTGQYPE